LGSPLNINDSAPAVIVIFSGSISPQRRKAEPVIARHREQWQLNATTNSSATLKATVLQAQRPASMTTH
jgi:hypothetical protein